MSAAEPQNETDAEPAEPELTRLVNELGERWRDQGLIPSVGED